MSHGAFAALRRERTAWFAGGMLATVVALAAGGLTACKALDESGPTSTEQQRQTYQQQVTRIELDVESGDVTLSPGDAGKVDVERRLEWRRSRPTITEVWAGTTVRITTMCPETNCETNYVVRVPVDISVDAHTEAGTITTHGITGEQSLRSDAGDVRVTDATGKLTAHSDSGDVEGNGLASGETEAGTNAGDVNLRFVAAPGRVSATSEAGGVDVAVPRNGSGYRVEAEMESGTRAVDVEQNAGSPHVVAVSSGAGDVRVRYS